MLRVSTANLSLQYVNSMNCIVRSDVGILVEIVVGVAYDK